MVEEPRSNNRDGDYDEDRFEQGLGYAIRKRRWIQDLISDDPKHHACISEQITIGSGTILLSITLQPLYFCQSAI